MNLSDIESLIWDLRAIAPKTKINGILLENFIGQKDVLIQFLNLRHICLI